MDAGAESLFAFGGFLVEGFARDVLVEFDVAVGDACYDFVRHFGHLLSRFALETILHQPFANELLGELLLRLAGFEAFLIAFAVEVAAGVGRVDFVHQIDFAVVLAKFILRINEDEAALGSHLRAAGKEGEGVFLEFGIFLGRGEALCEDFLLRDVGIVLANLRLGGRGDDGRGELLVFAHAVGEADTANLAHTALVGAPSRAAEVAAHNHFNGEALAAQAHRHHGVGRGEFPVGADVRRGIEKLGGNLVEHLSLEGNALGQNHIKGRDAVGRYHH